MILKLTNQVKIKPAWVREKSTTFMSPPMGDNYNFMSKLNNHTLNPSNKGGSNGWVNLKERQNIAILQCIRIACERLSAVTR